MFPIIKGSTLNINYNVGQASNRIKVIIIIILINF